MSDQQSDIVLAKDLPQGVEIITHVRELHMYQVTRDELDDLKAAGNYKTLDIAMLALCIGIFMSSFITLLTVTIANVNVLATFVVVCTVTGIASLFFGVRARMAWRAASTQFGRIVSDD